MQPEYAWWMLIEMTTDSILNILTHFRQAVSFREDGTAQGSSCISTLMIFLDQKNQFRIHSKLLSRLAPEQYIPKDQSFSDFSTVESMEGAFL